MSTGAWYGIVAAGLLASLAACGHEKRAKTAQASPAQVPPQQQPVQQAPTLQQELAESQTRLQRAHQDVVKAQEQLAQAQRREEQERANVQQLEIRARQNLDRASQLAHEAEQAQGLLTARGRVAQATPSRVLLQMQDGRTMSFQVDQRTRVLVGAEQRSVSEIQQGADARVAYEPKGAEPTAITIRVAPVGSEMGVTPASPTRPGDTGPAVR